MVPVFFMYEFGTKDFKMPTLQSTAIRLICALLLHMIIFEEVKQALNVLRYLKYVKTAQGGKRGRMINIALACMQLISPLATEIVLILAINQESQLAMIVKSFVALGFVIKVDDMFSENFPTEIKNTSKSMSLVIGKDQNTYKKIVGRLSKQKDKKYCDALTNLLINCLYFVLNTFYIVIYYYFMPITCVIIQFYAFYYQQISIEKPAK